MSSSFPIDTSGRNIGLLMCATYAFSEVFICDSGDADQILPRSPHVGCIYLRWLGRITAAPGWPRSSWGWPTPGPPERSPPQSTGSRRRDDDEDDGTQISEGTSWVVALCIDSELRCPFSGTLYSSAAAAAAAGIPGRRRRPLVTCRIRSPHYV
jgi:hypothetical protein